MANDEVVARLIESSEKSRRDAGATQGGRKGCITCARRICPLLKEVASDETEPVIKAGEIHSFKAVGDSPLVQIDVIGIQVREKQTPHPHSQTTRLGSG